MKSDRFMRAKGLLNRILPNSIIYKLLFVCIVLIIVPVICTTYVSLIVYKNSIESLSKEHINESIKRTNIFLEEFIDEISKITFMVYESRAPMGFNYPSVFEYLSRNVVLPVDEEKKERDIVSFLNILNDYAPNKIFNIFIIDAEGKCYYAWNEKNINSVKYRYDFLNQDWFKNIKDNISRAIIIKTNDEVDKGYLHNKTDKHLMLIARNIYDIGRDLKASYIGTLCINVDLSFLNSYLEYENTVSQRISLVDDNGTVIYSTDKKVINTHLQAYDDVKDDEVNSKSVNMVDRDNYILSYSFLEKTGWTIIGETNREQLLAGRIKQIKATSVAVIVLFLFLAVIVLKLLYNFTAIPVDTIKRNMKKIESGILAGFDSVKAKDEFGEINGKLIIMAQNLKSHIEKAYIAEIKKHEANLYALQSQVNPHFIMNSLEAVRMNLLSKNEKEPARIIGLIGIILREHLVNTNRIIAISEEIELIKKYIEVEQFRFSDRISVEIELPETIMSYKIPKMTIQPILSNAFKHGIERKRAKCIIRIYSFTTDKYLKIIVMDNGIGMNVEKLNAINKTLEDDEWNLDSEHIGLKNVHERIRNYFGREFGIKIASSINEGTSVEMMLPLDRRSC